MRSRLETGRQSVADEAREEKSDILGSDALLAEVAGLDVRQLLMGAASTLASLAYAKLERNDLAQAKLAIDGVSALLPLLDGDLQRDLAQALAGLQVAFVDAAKLKED
jgi:hypothetical protein